MSVKYGFVILNYMTREETKGCIESIDSHIGESHEIIVVDNASPDYSGEELRKAYENRNDVKVILNTDNLGYACGNNVGIERARADGCDYVIVLNSDTRIMQNEFCSIVYGKYEEHHYAVMGPRIFKHGAETNDNPGRDKLMSRCKLHVFIAMNRMFLILSYMGIDSFLNSLFNAYVEARKKEGAESKDVEKVALHGCCLVFTPSFFSKFNGFDDRTYMYMEEDVLYHHLMKSGLVSAYIPELFIEHFEEAATGKIYSGAKKRRFKYKNYIKSSKVLLRIDKEMV